MPFLSKTKGAIVNTSSASGTTTFPLLLTAYGTVKGGLAHFTKYAAAHGFKHSGVRANAIAPGKNQIILDIFFQKTNKYF